MRNLKKSRDDKESRSQAHRDVDIHKRNEPAADRIQDHDDIGHMAQVQHVSEKARDRKEAEDSRIKRPQSAEWNRFVVLTIFVASFLLSDLRKKNAISTHDNRDLRELLIRCKKAAREAAFCLS